MFEDRDRLKEELTQLQREYDQAMAAPVWFHLHIILFRLYLTHHYLKPPIVKLKADNVNLKRDQVKFTSVNNHHRGKIDKYREAVKTLQSEIGTLGIPLSRILY